MAKKWQTKIKGEEKLKLKTPPEITPPNTHNASSPPPLGRIYHVSSLNNLVSKRVLPTFVHILSLFGNELVKHKLREA
jgi:hypothetical protein